MAFVEFLFGPAYDNYDGEDERGLLADDDYFMGWEAGNSGFGGGGGKQSVVIDELMALATNFLLCKSICVSPF